MEPNLELVTGSFFTGMSKAGSVLRERTSEAFLKGNFRLLNLKKKERKKKKKRAFVFGMNSHFFLQQRKHLLFVRWGQLSAG